jgi:hypothetical protein
MVTLVETNESEKAYHIVSSQQNAKNIFKHSVVNGWIPVKAATWILGR